MQSCDLPSMIKSHTRNGERKSRKYWWLENLLQSKLYQEQLHGTLETGAGNESGLHIMQKTNAYTCSAQWAFNRRQPD